MKELFHQILLFVSLASIPAMALSSSETLDIDTRHRSIESHGKAIMAAMTDAWLKGKIESALALNEYLKVRAIEIDVHHNRVYLAGVVSSDIDADLARQIAQSVDGVENVINQLTIDPSVLVTADSKDNSGESLFHAKVKDATRAARIKSELRNALPVRAHDIDVESYEGRLVLTGFVESEQTKQRAGEIARQIDETGAVENRIRVK